MFRVCHQLNFNAESLSSCPVRMPTYGMWAAHGTEAGAEYNRPHIPPSVQTDPRLSKGKWGWKAPFFIKSTQSGHREK